MKEKNSVDENTVEPKWLIPLAFVAISVVGYLGFAFRGNYFDALGIPVVVGFIWLAGVKQKLTLAVSLVAVFILMAIPVMTAGYMQWHILDPIITTVVFMILGMGVYKFSLRKAVAMFSFFFCSILLLYAFDLIDQYTFLPLIVGGGVGVLTRFLLADKLAVSQ